MNKLYNEQGFSLVELVVVIILIAILSAILIPRFLDMKDEAQLAQVRATAGAFKTAVQQVKLRFAMLGYATRVQNIPGFGGGNVDTNNIGFPIGTTKGNGNENIGVGNNGCADVWNGIMNVSSTASTGNTTDFQTYRHTGNRVCSYVYRGNGDTANRVSAQLVIQYDSRDGQIYICGTLTGLSVCTF